MSLHIGELLVSQISKLDSRVLKVNVRTEFQGTSQDSQLSFVAGLCVWVWVGGTSPLATGHPISICDIGVNYYNLLKGIL